MALKYFDVVHWIYIEVLFILSRRGEVTSEEAVEVVFAEHASARAEQQTIA